MPRDAVAERWLTEVGKAKKITSSDDLVLSHLLLATKLAGRYRGRGVDYADLIGEANLALVEAARAWPRSKVKQKGMPFSLYAQKVIRNRLITAVIKAEPVSIEAHAWFLMKKGEKDETGSDEDIAANLGVSVKRIRHLRRLAHGLKRAVHWEDPVNSEEDLTYAEVVPDAAQDVEETVLAAMEREEVRRELIMAVDDLPPAARLAVSLRFGMETPSMTTLSFDEVLRVSAGTHNVDNGTRRLREKVKADGRLVSEDRKPFVSLTYSPFRPGSEARILRDKNKWRSIASEQAPPGLATRVSIE